MKPVERPAFCLGCGRDCGTVEVVPRDPYVPVPQTAHPSWCDRESCREARERFHAAARRVLDEL